MRVSIFFDGKNFYSGWQDRASAHELDFAKLSQWLVARAGGSQLWGAHYYVGIETGVGAETAGQQKLASFLRGLELLPGYFVQRFARKARSFRCPGCRATHRFTQEKEVDTTMVADMLRLAAVNSFDAAILISGDRDHLPAVQGIQALGKKAYVASWGGRGLSAEIRAAVFDHMDLLEGIGEFKKASASVSPGKARMEPRPKPRFSGSAAVDVSQVFMRELRLAEAKFGAGYVGLTYFLKRWECPELDPSEAVRGRVLDRLVKDGKIEIYPASDGNTAIKSVTTLPLATAKTQKGKTT